MKYDPKNYFIFGHATTPEEDGMAKHVHVCPGFGSDWGVIYVHSDTVKRLTAEVARLKDEIERRS
jgi:hypothetical protein